ncbi:MAG: transcriptional regulator [Nitrosopumilus sp.]|nr:transcriptional regulator [Nitrosopumilus sp.]MDH3487646.1 transcriptional regulator [Nitrosopumilus sp.]
MGEFDYFLAQSLDHNIRTSLSDNAINKIETRLFEKYGITLTTSIEQFNKLDSILREFFGEGADGIEEKLFNNILELKDHKQDVTSENAKWITIKDTHLINLILDVFGDEDKKKICTSVTNEGKIIYKILKECQIPQTSGYRKINSLIKNGLLTIDDHISTNEGKKVNTYKFLFQNVQINIIKKQITVEVQLNEQGVENSSVLLAIKGL